jgi:hypothetical protein
MEPRTLTLEQLLRLIEIDAFRGIIDIEEFLAKVVKYGIPKEISDIRGAVRMTLERTGKNFAVIQYPTELSNEMINEIY